MLTFENRAFRDVASFAPYEFVEILTNTRTYGGGGIFNLYSTVAADSLWAPYVFVHEFGHHFAGLADEYYTSDVAYGAGDGAHRALGAQRDRAERPGQSQVEGPRDSAGTPLPTPWPKEAFETDVARDPEARAGRSAPRTRPEEEMDALFLEEKDAETKLLARRTPTRRRSAPSRAPCTRRPGYYRPQIDCIMFTRDDACRSAPSAGAAIETDHRYSRPGRFPRR